MCLDLLGLGQDSIEEYKFEKIVDSEERTNFDFYIELASGRKIFFEVKYTEDGFGKATDSAKYRKKYQDVYRARVDEKSRADIPPYQTLIENYQLLRNISYLGSEDMLIIICPEGNTKVLREFENVRDHVIQPWLKDHIRFVTWEQLVEELKARLMDSLHTNDRLLEHYSSFEKKYIL